MPCVNILTIVTMLRVAAAASHSHTHKYCMLVSAESDTLLMELIWLYCRYLKIVWYGLFISSVSSVCVCVCVCVYVCVQEHNKYMLAEGMHAHTHQNTTLLSPASDLLLRLLIRLLFMYLS